MYELDQRAARAVHLAAQGLLARSRGRARKADVLAAIRRMAVLQIDTIHIVARSPYLVLWSRLGPYEPAWLEAHLAEGALFEYWAHEASFVPMESYPLLRHRMLRPDELGWKYRGPWMRKHAHEVNAVLGHIREHGAVRSADFSRRDGDGAGGWWGWKTEKRVLEGLFSRGQVMVAARENFQRVYDLRERVLPEWDDIFLPSREDASAELVLSAVRALGVTRAAWVADYWRMDRRSTPGLVRELAAAGLLLHVTVQGREEPWFAHPDHAALLQDAAAGRLRPRLTTVLSPFDPVVWDRRRARELFGFDYRLECYTPAPKRRWGYFVLPLLRNGELIGRLDAKAHRAEGRFEVKGIWLEVGVRATAALVRDVGAALRDIAAWHGTPEVVIRKAEPAAFGTALLDALTGD